MSSAADERRWSYIVKPDESLSESLQRPVRGTGEHKYEINKAKNIKDGQSSNEDWKWFYQIDSKLQH